MQESICDLEILKDQFLVIGSEGFFKNWDFNEICKDQFLVIGSEGFKNWDLMNFMGA